VHPYSFRSVVAVALTLAGIAACQHGRTAAPVSAPPNVAVVDEIWISAYDEADNVDSLAVAADAGLVIATSKSRHQLLLFDSATGEMTQRVGGPGEAPGQFARPNGIAVVDDLVLVVERDNHRVQVLRLPTFEPLGMVGEDILHRPYGVAAFLRRDGGVDVWITDNFDLPAPDSSRLTERIRHFRIQMIGDELHWKLVNTFGERRGRGALHKVETIGADPARGLLLVAEEAFERMGLMVYTTDGAFTGTVVGAGIFLAEPEGVALWESEESSYWIATDQPSSHSIFHLFESRDFAHLGSFRGRVTANTDGVAISNGSINGFPNGAFFAVHDDGAVAAFDLAQVRKALPANDKEPDTGGTGQ
jgi:3-phytase